MAGAYASRIQRTAVSCHVLNVMQHHLASLPPLHHSPRTMMIMGFYLWGLGGKIAGNASLTKGDRHPYVKSNIFPRVIPLAPGGGERSRKGRGCGKGEGN